MTNQELFDETYRRVATQGRPSVKNGRCYYREDETPGCATRCAAGHWIRDEDYDPRMERHTLASGELVRDALRANGIHVDQIPLMVQLQAVHDASSEDSDFRNEYHRRMVALASQWGLTPPPAPPHG